jgi:hypothetical protein
MITVIMKKNRNISDEAPGVNTRKITLRNKNKEWINMKAITNVK